MELMLWVVGLGGALLAALALVGGYQAHEHREQLRATGGRARGVVVRNRVDNGRTTFYWPVVRFTTAQGTMVEGEETYGSALSIPRYPQGTPVWVAYAKANPQDFTILTPGRFA